MSDMKIVDKDGIWVINQGEYRVPDYVRHSENPGTDLILLEPGVPTKIKMSAFLREQVAIVEIEDPTQSDGVVVKAPAPEPEVVAPPAKGGK